MTKYLELSKVLDFINKEIVKYIANLTEKEVEDILNEKVNLRISLQAKNSKLGSKTNSIRKNEPNNEEYQENDLINSEENLLNQHSHTQAISIKEIAQRLHELNSREEGLLIINQYLTGKKAVKKDLQKLAEYLKISQSQKYNISELQEKIIEATIGCRLRSQAIRGDIQIVDFYQSTENQVHEQENQPISEQTDIQNIESENPTENQVHEQENQSISEQTDIQNIESENPTENQVHEQENQPISEQTDIQIVESENPTVNQGCSTKYNTSNNLNKSPRTSPK